MSKMHVEEASPRGADQVGKVSDLERHHWQRGHESSRTYGTINGKEEDILPQGAYPGIGAKIAMAHDTDWSLGRYFQAGPMMGLYDSKESAAEMGMYRLQNHCKVEPKLNDLYIDGHNDWSVNFNQHPTRQSAIERGDGVAIASAQQKTHHHQPTLITIRSTSKRLQGLKNYQAMLSKTMSIVKMPQGAW
jgi:hypothetical protein